MGSCASSCAALTCGYSYYMPGGPLAPKLFGNLKDFYSSSAGKHFKQEEPRLASIGLNSNDLYALLAQFNLIDADGSGEIDTDEVSCTAVHPCVPVPL